MTHIFNATNTQYHFYNLIFLTLIKSKKDRVSQGKIDQTRNIFQCFFNNNYCALVMIGCIHGGYAPVCHVNGTGYDIFNIINTRPWGVYFLYCTQQLHQAGQNATWMRVHGSGRKRDDWTGDTTEVHLQVMFDGRSFFTMRISGRGTDMKTWFERHLQQKWLFNGKWLTHVSHIQSTL